MKNELSNAIKIALVDDHKCVCTGMEKVINSFTNMKVINQSYSGKQILNYLETASQIPDVILLDINMPEMNGLETLQILTEKYPTIKVIMLTFHDEPSYILRMIESGAVGYLNKDFQSEEIEHTIRYVNMFGRYFNDSINALIQERLSNPIKPKIKLDFEKDFLTIRETELLGFICQQKTNIEIADILALSTRTIESQRAALMRKVRVDNTVGLVLFAVLKRIHLV